MEHDAVTETAIVDIPNERRGEISKVYVILKETYEPIKALKDEIQQYVKANLSPHEYPREVEFVDVLPKTPRGKIQRFLLKG